MKKNLTIKEKIQYLTWADSVIKILGNKLEEAKNEKADYMLKQQEQPDDIWLEDVIEERTAEIKALGKLIEDLENLTD